MPSAVDDDTGKFTPDPQLRFKHPYPATKLMFIPDKECAHPDLIATTGDYLRIWQVKEEEVILLKLLNNVSIFPIQSNVCTDQHLMHALEHFWPIFECEFRVGSAAMPDMLTESNQNKGHTLCCLLQNKNSEFCAPLTSFDWNETDPKRLGTSSIDTTCTIWDIEVYLFCLTKWGSACGSCQINCAQGLKLLLPPPTCPDTKICVSEHL